MKNVTRLHRDSQNVTVALLALFGVTVAALTYAQQGTESEAGSGTPPKAEWSKMDCSTSGCHSDYASKKIVHAPVAQNSCGMCHEVAEEAEHTFKFEEEMPDMCIQCHEKIGDALAEDSDSKSRHFPAAEGDCSTCHDPHATDAAGLLTSAHPGTKYVRFSEEAYELCFACHDAEAMSEPQVDDETEFRNGAANLHYLHVAKNRKGRSCHLCHDAHAAAQPGLVRKAVLFNKWPMPIDYRSTDTGGYCGPACHAAKSYDRESPVDWNVPATAPE